MSASPNTLRWLAVVPAALVSAFVVMFPVHWVVMFTFGGWGYDPVIEIRNLDTLLYIEQVFQSLFGPLALVYFAAWTAPSHRVVTSVIFSGIVIIGHPAFVYFWNANVVSNGSGIMLDFDLAKFVARIIGVAGAVLLIRSREQEKG